MPSRKLERDFQPLVIKKLEARFPGCVILKNDPNYIQGFPDLTVLYKKNWAVLETKRDEKATYRPNQEYYIALLDGMSFSRAVCPDNIEEVLDDIQRSFES